jgi:serine/threonine protein kinase
MEPIQIGKYSIVEKIGEGSMGEVYKAHDPTLHRYVAVKTISHSRNADPEHRERFLREARSAAQLNHNHIVTVFDYGEDEGRIFMAMELLEGTDLKDLIQQGKSLSLSDKLRLMEQICDGVGFAHAKGIVHRDLKPGNIHVQPDGQVKIMDFGLARLESSDITKTGVVMGTPNYMSPEQVQAKVVDSSSDVFSLGAVFYELLSNRKPFEADTLHATLFKVVQGDREPISKWNANLPEPVVRIVDKALSKRREDRYENGYGLLHALREVRTRLGSAIEADEIWSSDLQETLVEPPLKPAPPPSPRSHKPVSPEPSPSRRPVHRGTLRRSEVSAWRSSWMAYAAGGLALVVLSGLALHLFSPSSEPRADASIEERAVASESSLQNELALARKSLDEKDYAQAIALTEAILESNPNHGGATKILEEARRTLQQLDQSLEEARTLLASGQEEQAARQLAVALAIQPTNPVAVELSSTLNSHFREQAESARGSTDRSKQAATEAGAGDRDAFQRAEALLEQAEAQLQQEEYAAATQKILAAKELFDRARLENEREAELTRAAARARTELQEVVSQWERKLAEARSEDVQDLTEFQSALSLEDEAERLANGKRYAEATRVFRDAIDRLGEARERAQQRKQARKAEEEASPEPAARSSSPSLAPPQPPEPVPEAVPTVEQETQAIRNVISNWKRAIETQDIDLYRSVKPNLSSDDERHLRASFEAVDSQQVEISILTIDLQGNRASVRLARSDTIVANGRKLSASIEQTLLLSKEVGGWIIVTIGE